MDVFSEGFPFVPLIRSSARCVAVVERVKELLAASLWRYKKSPIFLVDSGVAIEGTENMAMYPTSRQGNVFQSVDAESMSG